MPPGPAYNWLCVAHSVCDILSHAAQIRAAQLARTGRVVGGVDGLSRKRKRDESYSGTHTKLDNSETAVVQPVQSQQEPLPRTGTSPLPPTSSAVTGDPSISQHRAAELPSAQVQHGRLKSSPKTSEAAVAPSTSFQPVQSTPTVNSQTAVVPEPPTSPTVSSVSPRPTQAEEVPSVGDVSASTGIPDPGEPLVDERPRNRNLQSSKVPSSRIGRLFHYGGLAASLGYGAASELLRRSTSTSDDQAPQSLMLTEGNIKRLVSKLTQMRGAALKLGQFMSIQDSHVLPPEIEDIFRRVQDSAHYMPDWQMEKVLSESLGSTWMDNFESFDRMPFAAASIGQVHSAVLKASASPTGKAAPVAVKIQFPNIVNSINSDLGYVKMLLTAGRLLPPGLFLDRTIQVMKEELADECNYAREASFLRRFGQPDHLGADPRFKVPWVWEGSTDRVLVMEHVGGVSVGGSIIDRLSQRDRDDIAARIIDLCLRELFVYRVMQTDPNWTNFLWNPRTRQVELVDFGATREYTKEFIDNWLHLLSAAVSEDREACIEWSLKLGYLTGEENEIMLDAHVKSMVLLGTPFNASTPQPFKFGTGSTWADITAEIRAQIPVMLQHRLTPPPRETYSLNRKLSGAFLLASRLNASVDCKALWTKVVEGYHYG
ncbi:ABC1 family-domain-containing protein [Earliella scabrosa]|nr:ABC1 family-domain-containing protein [Earliella scabrosa]